MPANEKGRPENTSLPVCSISVGVLLAGCSSALPVSSSSLQYKDNML